MKRILSIVLLLIMTMGMAGCGSRNSINIEELKKKDGVML